LDAAVDLPEIAPRVRHVRAVRSLADQALEEALRIVAPSFVERSLGIAVEVIRRRLARARQIPALEEPAAAAVVRRLASALEHAGRRIDDREPVMRGTRLAQRARRGGRWS